MYTYEYVTHKFNQDLIDYKNRDLVINETKDIRNILYVKALVNTPSLKIEASIIKRNVPSDFNSA